MNSGTRSKPFTIWLSGQSGVGKTTLAEQLQRDVSGLIIDGDALRRNPEHLPADVHPFGFEARKAQVIFAAKLAKDAIDDGKNALVALISPDRIAREMALRLLEYRCLVVHLQCPWIILRQRDVKGIYKRALAGELQHVCGVDFYYDAPTAYENPLTIDTSIMSPDCASRLVVQTLKNRGWLDSST